MICAKNLVAEKKLKCDHSNCRNGLNPLGSLTLHPQSRNNLGGCESADHPKTPEKPREACAFGRAFPFWFRLRRLRVKALAAGMNKAEIDESLDRCHAHGLRDVKSRLAQLSKRQICLAG